MRFFGKGKCKFIANFSATMVTSLPSISLSLSLCISLSLSPKVPHAQYRKRFRASFYTEKEREREKDGSDVTIVALKLAMSFCTSPCQKCAPQYWRRVLRFSLPKFCTSVSHLLKCAEFTLSIAKNVALFETVRILRTVKWRDWQGIEAAKHTIEFPAAPFFFLVEKIEKMNQINTKNYWKKKKRLCVRLRLGNKHHLRKSADRKAQIRKAFVPLTELICAFRSADFSGGVYSPSATSRTISFSISNSFWY